MPSYDTEINASYDTETNASYDAERDANYDPETNYDAALCLVLMQHQVTNYDADLNV